MFTDPIMNVFKDAGFKVNKDTEDDFELEIESSEKFNEFISILSSLSDSMTVQHIKCTVDGEVEYFTSVCFGELLTPSEIKDIIFVDSNTNAEIELIPCKSVPTDSLGNGLFTSINDTARAHQYLENTSYDDPVAQCATFDFVHSKKIAITLAEELEKRGVTELDFPKMSIKEAINIITALSI